MRGGSLFFLVAARLTLSTLSLRSGDEKGDRPSGANFQTRSQVMGLHGAAASSHPAVSQAALDILKSGGSAVDASIAANAVQGLVEPMSNGIGGDLFVLLYDPKVDELEGYNGSGRSSKTFSYNAMLDEVLFVNGDSEPPLIPTHGPLSVTIPGAVRGWCDLNAKHGKKSISELLRPAIKMAREGFPVTEIIAKAWEDALEDFLSDKSQNEITLGGKYPNAFDGFLNTFAIKDDNGWRAPKVGEIFVNSDLADTYELIAEEGCRGFYEGRIAQSIAEYEPLHITSDDLKSHEGEFIKPVSTHYRGNYEVFELPPNTQGISALQMLNILESFNLTEMGQGSADAIHVQVEAKKLAFADRAAYFGDPNFYDAPIESLLSKDYGRARAKLIDMKKAAKIVEPGVFSTVVGNSPSVHAEVIPNDDTIYMTVVDEEGMMVSWIQSLYNHFGSGIVVGGLGFPLQDRGALYALEPINHPNVFAENKRPFHTIIPAFVKKDDKPFMSFGVMVSYSGYDGGRLTL